MSTEPKLVWDVAAELGEGPVWVERERALYFVDIKKHLVHRYDPADGGRTSWQAPEQVGFVFPAVRGGFVAGLESGLHHFDERTGSFDLITEIEPHIPTNRLNDAVVDPEGRLWFGSMDNGETDKSGSFYCFGNGEVRHSGIDGIAITNGPAISPDGSTFYFIDTRERTVEAADIESDGTLANRRDFVRFDPTDGNPDGPTIDSEGCVWVSMYNGWAALRYSPAGELVERVPFPVSNITKIAFGGDDLRTAYATTARQLLSEEEIAKQPEIGHLFEFRTDVPGIPCPLVRY